MSLSFTRAIARTPATFRAHSTRTRSSIPRIPTSSTQSHRGRVISYLLAGTAGGLVVIGAAYTWYHFSGIKKVVNSAQNVKAYLETNVQPLIFKKSSNKALTYLRNSAKAYVAAIPGSDFLVDQAFDSLDDVVEAHGEEAKAIASTAYAEIQEIARRNGKESLATAVKSMGVLKQRLGEIQNLGTKAGGDALSPLWAKFSEARKRNRDEPAPRTESDSDQK